jgi:3-hydroxy acid dehydrogenase/malonic semialdehyde reductase
MNHTVVECSDGKALTLITGASSGIGLSTARYLAREGRAVLLAARREDRLKEQCQRLREELGSQAPPIMYVSLDVTKEEQVDELVELLEEKNWDVDVLVNNAGLALGKRGIHENTSADIADMIAVNVLGFTTVLNRFLPLLQKTGGDCIALGSVSGSEPYPGGAIYCGTKAFVHQLMRAARMDLCGSGVRLTVVAPGAVANTEFSDVRMAGDEAAVKAVYAGFVPLHPDDIAEVISFVLSRPQHVNLSHVEVMPRAQGSARDLSRKA